MKKALLLFVIIISIPYFLSSCKSGEPNQDNQNLQVVYKAIDAFTTGNAGAIDSLCSADYIEHQIDTAHTRLRGLAALKDAIVSSHKALPDMKTVIHSIAVSGDTVLVYNTSSGTMKDTLMGIPPTNKQVSLSGVDVFLVMNGKIKEHWGFVDMNDMAQFTPPKAMTAGNTKNKKK